MKKRWSTLLAAGAGTAAIGLTGPALALTDSQRFEKLEQHIQQLERRLEQTEAENQKLKKHSGAKEPAYASRHPSASGYETSPDSAVAALASKDQKVKELDHRSSTVRLQIRMISDVSRF